MSSPEKQLRVLVTGSRGWTDAEAIHRESSTLSGKVVVIHGGAKGADSIAGEIAGKKGVPVRVIQGTHGGAASVPARARNDGPATTPDGRPILALTNGQWQGEKRLGRLWMELRAEIARGEW